jgi:hypothetical protein
MVGTAGGTTKTLAQIKSDFTAFNPILDFDGGDSWVIYPVNQAYYVTYSTTSQITVYHNGSDYYFLQGSTTRYRAPDGATTGQTLNDYDAISCSVDSKNILYDNSNGPQNQFFNTEAAPATDECPNIEGLQATIPDGMEKDTAGNCVTSAPPPPPPDSTNQIMTFEQKAGTLAALVVSGWVINQFRYKGAD